MIYRKLAQQLAANADAIGNAKVVTGFDAFVDELISVVDERSDTDSYRRVETISQFGELICAAAGHSSLREVVVSRTEAGGCAINMGDGLATLGVQVDTFATAGEPVHAAFADFAAKATLHSWGSTPGRTQAYEFADGKLMFSAVSQLAELTPAYITQRLTEGQFQSACKQASLIALTDWTLYPHMTACWHLLLDQVFSKLQHRPRFFFDLVDPSSRSHADIRSMLDALHRFEACGQTTLGLNQNEANILSKVTGVPLPPKSDIETSSAQALALRQALGISEIVIHAHKYAVVANEDGACSGMGPFCEKPQKSTGAGDRFNAGYALGILLDCTASERIALATSVSGMYVRTGKSPTLAELISFLAQRHSLTNS